MYTMSGLEQFRILPLEDSRLIESIYNEDNMMGD